MRRLIYLTLCVVASMIGIEASAQMRSAYFMEGSYFRNELNPALAPTRGYIALPIMGGIGVNMNNNFMSVNNFFYKNGNEVVTALHESISADKFLGRLPKTGKLAVNLNTNILGTGFYTKKSYWNFGINLRSNNELTISKDIFKVLKSLGNGLAPAMHKNNLHAHSIHECNVRKQGIKRRLALHHTAAHLDQHGRAAEILNVRQRLSQHRRLVHR